MPLGPLTTSKRFPGVVIASSLRWFESHRLTFRPSTGLVLPGLRALTRE